MQMMNRTALLLICASMLGALGVAESPGTPASVADKGLRSDAFTWGLDLPEHAVPRRISRRFDFHGPEPQVLGEIAGAGCIRRFWVTGDNLGREVILRIYFDGEKIPYVEAPINDFFGAMHNLMARRYPPQDPALGIPDGYYRINTPFLAIKPKSGFTSYFPMPFAESARLEVVGGEERSTIYYLIDWHEYPDQELTEPMRFSARWRREAPVRDYADDFIMLDADGPGRLVGFVFSVDMLQDRREMRWSHGGAENIYIDGMGRWPAYLRGIGGEDSFGSSYSGGDYPPGTSIFSDMPYYIWKDPDGLKQKLVGYRFFFHDAILFDESLHMRFGARAHDLAATVFWYSSRPVRPYFETPPVEQRMPGSELRRGEFDLPLPDYGQWWVAGPFEEAPDALPGASAFDPAAGIAGRPWQRVDSLRGFVEFNHIYRPDPSNENSPTLEGVAVARSTLVAPRSGIAQLTLGWDDRLLLQVNDESPQDLGNYTHFQSKTIEVPLDAGENSITLSLSNATGFTRGAWNFSFRAVTEDGNLLLPQAP